MGRVGLVLTVAGAAVWVFGVLAWALGVWVTLPPDAVRALVLGLAAFAGTLLLAAGAVLGRAARRRRVPPALSASPAAPHLPRAAADVRPSSPNAHARERAT